MTSQSLRRQPTIPLALTPRLYAGRVHIAIYFLNGNDTASVSLTFPVTETNIHIANNCLIKYFKRLPKYLSLLWCLGSQ